MEESSQGTRTVGGNFRLEKRLDSSGAFQTYQARAPDGQTVVVKILPAPSAETVVQAHPAVRAGAPAHPNLVPVLEWGEDDGDFYVVRDYVAGSDLKSMVDASGALSVPLATGYVLQAASALAALQSSGLVHGNVKTANLLLPVGSEQVKVVGIGTGAVGGASSGTGRPSIRRCLPEPRTDPRTGGHAPLGRVLAGCRALRASYRPAAVRRRDRRRGRAETADPASAPAQSTAPGHPGWRGPDRRSARCRRTRPRGTVRPRRCIKPWASPPGPAAAQPQKRKMWPYLLAGVVVLALIAACRRQLGARNSTDVPDLGGLTLAQATASLIDAAAQPWGR